MISEYGVCLVSVNWPVGGRNCRCFVLCVIQYISPKKPTKAPSQVALHVLSYSMTSMLTSKHTKKGQLAPFLRHFTLPGRTTDGVIINWLLRKLKHHAPQAHHS